MISIKNLSKSYDDHSGHQKVFENVSYEFGDKGAYSIVGSSGSGKTTLLNLISGLDSFDNGTIEVINQNLSILSVEERSALRKKYFGFGYQFHYLLENLSIYENCLAANFGIDTDNIDKTLKKLGIENIKNKIHEMGPRSKVEKHKAKGKLTVRKRIDLLKDEESFFIEFSELAAYKVYDDYIPAAGIIDFTM